MTVVEYETWILWMGSDASTTYGKSWEEWLDLPNKTRSELVEDHLNRPAETDLV